MRAGSAIAICVALCLIISRIAGAHCDTMDGPVVTAAKAALEKGDVTPVLKWVKKEHEGEIRAAFEKTLKVRAQSPEAKGLADMYFFETLVRIHRAGEGAPYTGLKPAGTVEPPIALADKALESGSAEEMVKHITDAAAAGIRARFTRALEAKKRADETVDAGREFVEAYVDYTHYVLRLALVAEGQPGHHEEGEAGEGGHKQQER